MAATQDACIACEPPLAWPVSFCLTSSGMPAFAITETKEWRVKRLSAEHTPVRAFAFTAIHTGLGHHAGEQFPHVASGFFNKLRQSRRQHTFWIIAGDLHEVINHVWMERHNYTPPVYGRPTATHA
jgi:hypothetical protein